MVTGSKLLLEALQTSYMSAIDVPLEDEAVALQSDRPKINLMLF